MSDWTSWQELLWAVPSDMGWRWYALWGVVAGVASVLIFVVAVVPAAPSLATLARVVFLIGAALIPLSAVNSGWQPWIPAFYAASALLGALALTIRRCDDGTSITVLGALLGRARSAIERVSGRTSQ